MYTHRTDEMIVDFKKSLTTSIGLALKMLSLFTMETMAWAAIAMEAHPASSKLAVKKVKGY